MERKVNHGAMFRIGIFVGCYYASLASTPMLVIAAVLTPKIPWQFPGITACIAGAAWCAASILLDDAVKEHMRNNP